jgi:integrase
MGEGRAKVPLMPTSEPRIKGLAIPGTGRVDYFHPEAKKLVLRVTSTGVKSWTFVYRFAGRQKRHTFGRYPEVSLQAALRIVRDKLAPALATGRDPSAEKIEARTTGDFKALCEQFLDEAVPDFRPSSQASWTLAIKNQILPVWGSCRPVPEEMGRRPIDRWLQKVKHENGPHAANTRLTIVSRIFNWAIDKGILDWNPCHRMKKPGQEYARTRVLSLTEIKAILEWAEKDRLHMWAFWWLSFLTAQRRSEVLGMEWIQISWDERVWTFRGKGKGEGKRHVLPLSARAIEVLKRIQPVTGNTSFVMCNPNEYFRGQARPVTNPQKAVDRMRIETGIADFRVHDIRRTAATKMAELFNVSDEIISSILNHSSGEESKVTRKHYQLYRNLKPMREALEKWAGFLDKLSTGEIKPGEVVPLVAEK